MRDTLHVRFYGLGMAWGYLGLEGLGLLADRYPVIVNRYVDLLVLLEQVCPALVPWQASLHVFACGIVG